MVLRFGLTFAMSRGAHDLTGADGSIALLGGRIYRIVVGDGSRR